MNIIEIDIIPETPSQPARITRRSFVKRTTATVIVTVLALHAFRNEARAEESGGSSVKHPIKVMNATPDPVDPAELVGTATETLPNGNTRLHMIRNKISRSPEDLSKDKPAASKILSFTTTFAHFVSDDNGTTWPQAGEVTQNISVTVGNPNYPNKGKVTVSGSAEGKVSNGSMVFAVQALVEVDDYGVDLTVAIWGVITKSGTATVTNEGYKQIDLGDQLPAALSVVTANGDQVMSFTGSGNGQLHAIQVP